MRGKVASIELPVNPSMDYEGIKSANETLRYVLQFHGCFWHSSQLLSNHEKKLMSGASHENKIIIRYELS